MSEEVYAAAALSKAVSDRQFALLFEAADVPCPLLEDFQMCDDPAEQWLGKECMDCWYVYTKMQALIDLGMIKKLDDTTMSFGGEDSD